jgi:hypothetical protein
LRFSCKTSIAAFDVNGPLRRLSFSIVPIDWREQHGRRGIWGREGAAVSAGGRRPGRRDCWSIIEVLQEHLALAREGKLRSVAVVLVSADGAAIGTQWSCAHGDIASLIGKLTVLTHDMMAALQ